MLVGRLDAPCINVLFLVILVIGHDTQQLGVRDCGLEDVRLMLVDILNDLTSLQPYWRCTEVSDKDTELNAGGKLVNTRCGETHLVVKQLSIPFDDHEAGCIGLNGHPVLCTTLHRGRLGCEILLADVLI